MDFVQRYKATRSSQSNRAMTSEASTDVVPTILRHCTGPRAIDVLLQHASLQTGSAQAANLQVLFEAGASVKSVTSSFVPRSPVTEGISLSHFRIMAAAGVKPHPAIIAALYYTPCRDSGSHNEAKIGWQAVLRASEAYECLLGRRSVASGPMIGAPAYAPDWSDAL